MIFYNVLYKVYPNVTGESPPDWVVRHVLELGLLLVLLERFSARTVGITLGDVTKNKNCKPAPPPIAFDVIVISSARLLFFFLNTMKENTYSSVIQVYFHWKINAKITTFSKRAYYLGLLLHYQKSKYMLQS